MTGDRFGPYVLESRLGRGAMGEVWRAVDTSHGDRVVALKLLGTWLGGDSEFAQRFRNEADLAARLSGPHIIPIHSYGEIDGRLYIDMPLVRGTDLGDLIERTGPLLPERAVWIVEQVADALDVAHGAGLVHRDVKPSNVLLTGRPGREFAYLIDFGLARALDGARMSLSGAVIGTPHYMAPERFDGGGDHRSDVYALACVLHEALTGRRPFDATTLWAHMKAHQQAPRPVPSEIRPGVPRGFDEVVARGMATDPDARFSGAVELAAAARDALATAVGPITVTTALPPPTPPPLLPAPSGPDGPASRPVSGRVGSSVRGPIGERTLTGHTRGVSAVAVGRLDGRPVVVSGSDDATVRVWDLATGDPVGRPLTGHTDGVLTVATAELRARPVVVSGSSDRTIRVWDLATGAPVGDPLVGHTHYVFTVTVTALEHRPVVVSGSIDATVRVWDLATGDPIGRPLTGHTSSVSTVAAAALAGRRVVVSGSSDRTIRVWDLATGAPVGEPLTGHEKSVSAVAVGELRERPVIVSGSDDRTIRVWDLATGAPVGEPLTGHTSYVWGVAVSRLDGRPVVVSGSSDRTIRVWDLATGSPIGDPVTGHAGSVSAVATGELHGRPVIVSGNNKNTIRVRGLALDPDS